MSLPEQCDRCGTWIGNDGCTRCYPPEGPRHFSPTRAARRCPEPTLSWQGQMQVDAEREVEQRVKESGAKPAAPVLRPTDPAELRRNRLPSSYLDFD